MQDRAAKMQTAGARDATFLASESCGRLTREHRTQASDLLRGNSCPSQRLTSAVRPSSWSTELSPMLAVGLRSLSDSSQQASQ
jgi:hypothetical protein